MFAERMGPDGDKTVIVVERKGLADVAIAMSMYVDDA